MMKYTKYLSVLLFATLLSQYSMAADDYPEECEKAHKLMMKDAKGKPDIQEELENTYQQEKDEWKSFDSELQDVTRASCMETLSIFEPKKS